MGQRALTQLLALKTTSKLKLVIRRSGSERKDESAAPGALLKCSVQAVVPTPLSAHAVSPGLITLCGCLCLETCE